MNSRRVLRPIVVVALLTCISHEVRALQARFIDQLQPVGLPAGILFGGGGNSFERRVDVSGSLAVVGAGNFDRGLDQGHAFVYDFSNENDVRQIAMLRASDNAPRNEYGKGVAISGNYVFVSASGDSSDRGAIYMYDVSDPTNIIERKITAFDAAPGNYFGFSLSVDGNRLLAGAPKFSASSLPPAAYVIDFSDPDNLQQTKVVLNKTGADGDYGTAVALSGNYAIVGRSSDSTVFPFGGSAHLYDLTNLSAVREKILRPTDAPNYQSFGSRVAISGTKALVSVASDPGPTNNAGNFDGSVWAFDFSNWNSISQTEFGRPVPQFGGPSAPFGRFLDLQDNLSIAAAFNEDGARGAIYFHDVSNVNDPVELLRLPAHSRSDQRFGIALAVDGNALLVSDQQGHVYLYQLAIPEPASLALIGIALLLASRRRIRA